MSDSNYKWDADLYQNYSSGQFKLGIMAIDRLKPLESDQILEIGCGNGLLTIELAKKIPNGLITAIEISKDMIDLAKKNIKQQGIKNIDIINMNAINLNFKNKFDSVFSNSAIHWIKNQELLYQLIYDSLKPNGKIMIQTALRQESLFLNLIKNFPNNQKYQKYIKNKLDFPWRHLSEKEIKTKLHDIGFKNINVEILKFKYKFNDLSGLKGFCKAAPLVPYLNILPDDLKEPYVNEFCNTYLCNNENKLEVEMTRVFISAIK
ncbi:MAG: methyltransferase domain-containing protein [Candidatus Lokiarchaeota archaeon]|nr:methyltransferase domain-containing protein [Candidatus Lokiarchaeota archaeon]